MTLHSSAQLCTSAKLCNSFSLNRQRGIARGVSSCSLAGEGMKFHPKICVCTTCTAQLVYYRTCATVQICPRAIIECRHCSPLCENEVVQSVFFSGQKRPVNNLQKAVFVQIGNGLKFVTAKRLKVKNDCHVVKPNGATLLKNCAETWPRFGTFARHLMSANPLAAKCAD